MENLEVMEENEEPMDFEDIVFDDSSSSSDESVTQPLGKYYCSKKYRIKISVSISTVFVYTQSTAAPPPTELKYPAVVMRSHQMVVS